MGAKRIVVVQTAMPPYRTAFVGAVVDQLGEDVEFLVGREHFTIGALTEPGNLRNARPAGNVYLLGRRLLWQRGTIRAAVAAELCVLEINPRIISNWVTLVTRRVLRKRSALWGQAWSRSGPESATNKLRRLMCRQASIVIVYTESEREDLAPLLPRQSVRSAPNAIYSSSEMVPVPAAPDAADFVLSGRLEPEKKPLLAIEAFAEALDRLPVTSQLVIIGDGSLRERAEQRANELGVAQRVKFLGAVFELQRLREVYGRAVAALSPGYVGLSMTQCHAFGLPMIYARDEPHAPEIEGARENFNSIAVASDDAAELADAMVAIGADRQAWAQRRDAISSECRGRYSVEAMSEGFVAALREATDDSAV